MDIIDENKNCPYISRCTHVDCGKFCLKRFKTEYYFDSAFIPKDRRVKQLLHIDSDRKDEGAFTRLAEIENNIETFVENGNNLYIYSQNVGNGKTSWALRLANTYINNVWIKKDMEPIVLFISVPRF